MEDTPSTPVITADYRANVTQGPSVANVGQAPIGDTVPSVTSEPDSIYSSKGLDRLLKAATEAIQKIFGDSLGSDPIKYRVNPAQEHLAPTNIRNNWLDYSLDKKTPHNSSYIYHMYIDFGRVGWFSLSQLPGCCGVLVSHGTQVIRNNDKGIGTIFAQLKLDIAQYFGYSTILLSDVYSPDRHLAERAILSKFGYTELMRTQNRRTNNVVYLAAVQVPGSPSHFMPNEYKIAPITKPERPTPRRELPNVEPPMVVAGAEGWLGVPAGDMNIPTSVPSIVDVSLAQAECLAQPEG